MKKSFITLALLGLLSQSAFAACPTCAPLKQVYRPVSPACPICAPACPIKCAPACAPVCPAAPVCAPACPTCTKFKSSMNPITAAPLNPECAAITCAAAGLEAVPIPKKHWWNLKRTGYRAVLSGTGVDACTGCAAPIESKGIIVVPKKHFWEQERFIVVP